MNEPANYLVPQFGAAPEPFAKALTFAESLSRNSSAPRDIVILCHTKSWFIRSDSVGELLFDSLSRGDARKLGAGEAIALTANSTLRLESLQTIRKSIQPDIVLVHNADERRLNSLLYFDRVNVVIAVPLMVDRIQDWTLRERAIIPGAPVSAVGALAGNPVAIEALWALTYMVDHDHAWVSEAQREAAVELLWSIYTRGCRPSPREIKKWARLNGWLRSSAELLEQLAREVAQNRAYPKRLGEYWWPDTFDMLSSLAWERRNQEGRQEKI